MTDRTGTFCTRCGAPAPPDSAFCQECGHPLEEVDSTYAQYQGHVPNNHYRYNQDVAVYRAESRLKIVKVLLIIYLFFGALMAFVGIYIDTLIEIISMSPDTIDAMGIETFNDLVASADMLYLQGIGFAVSTLAVLICLIFTFIRKYHLVAVLLCAAGSIILTLPFFDGVIFTLIGLIVTYLLYTAKGAFTS